VTQHEYIGFGALKNLKNILSDYSLKKVFLVNDKTSYEACGAESALSEVLQSCETVTFSDFEPNPKVEDVKKGVQLFRAISCDAIIAVGGGSVIDMAKLINFFASNNIEPEQYLEGKEKQIKKGKLLIALPTTSGTGSEATHFAVLYVNNIKYSVAHCTVLPDIAIIDPQLTLSMPAIITASSGMDVLSQAIESYWNINSTNESKAYSKDAIKLTLENLKMAVLNPSDDSREAMAKAAHLAGKAINSTKTTAPHAVSYPLTSYFGIAHGHAVGLTLPSFLVYNSKVCDKDVLDSRGSDYVTETMNEILRLLGVDSADNGKAMLHNLMKEIGLETRLEPLGVRSENDIERIVENGFNPERVKNNPRKVTPEALHTILHQIF
jgi:alcohol dehydrogenase class IV